MWDGWPAERQQQNRDRDAKLFAAGSSAPSVPSSGTCQVSVIDDSHDKTDGNVVVMFSVVLQYLVYDEIWDTFWSAVFVLFSPTISL